MLKKSDINRFIDTLERVDSKKAKSMAKMLKKVKLTTQRDLILSIMKSWQYFYQAVQVAYYIENPNEIDFP